MLGNNVASATLAIAKVDTKRSYVRLLGISAAGATAESWFARVELTNGTTVTAYRLSDPASTIDVSFEVVQEAPGVLRSVQQMTINFTAGNQTGPTTLTVPVEPTRTEVFYLGCEVTTNGGGGALEQFFRAKLTDANTETMQHDTFASNAMTVGFVVVERYGP